MSPAATELLNAVLALPADDRAAVAAELEPFADPPLSPPIAWGPELRRRAARLDSGESKGIPVAEVFRIIQEQLEGKGAARG